MSAKVRPIIDGFVGKPGGGDVRLRLEDEYDVDDELVAARPDLFEPVPRSSRKTAR